MPSKSATSIAAYERALDAGHAAVLRHFPKALDGYHTTVGVQGYRPWRKPVQQPTFDSLTPEAVKTAHRLKDVTVDHAARVGVFERPADHDHPRPEDSYNVTAGDTVDGRIWQAKVEGAHAQYGLRSRLWVE